MSADLLRQNVIRRISELRAEKVANLRRCKPRAPMTMPDGGVIPASTAEELAFYAVDTNATIDALDLAVQAITEEFKKMTSPEEPAQEETEPTARRPFYG